MTVRYLSGHLATSLASISSTPHPLWQSKNVFRHRQNCPGVHVGVGVSNYPWLRTTDLGEKNVNLKQFLLSYAEKARAPHSSTLAWKIPWTEEPGRLQSMGSLRVGQDWATSLSRIGEGNGNPLQCSCLENLRDGGAWWAAVYRVAQSRTRLKGLGSSSSSSSSRCSYLCIDFIEQIKQIFLSPGMYHAFIF